MEKVHSREEVTKHLFANYPNEAGFHLTSDNQAFTEKHRSDAINHAKTLEDKTVDWVKNTKAKVEPENTEEVNERAQLFARHKELFGAEPAKNIGTDKLKAKITEKENLSKEAEAEMTRLTTRYAELFGAVADSALDADALRTMITEKEAEGK